MTRASGNERRLGALAPIFQYHKVGIVKEVKKNNLILRVGYPSGSNEYRSKWIEGALSLYLDRNDMALLWYDHPDV